MIMSDHVSIDPHRAALLVMDYQNAFVPRLPNGDELLERVSTAVSAVRAGGGHVGWVRIGFDDTDFDAIPPTSLMARFANPEGREQLHADAVGTQIHDALDVRPGDIAVRKRRVGAFTTTDLDRQLREQAIDTIVLAGINTSGVVLSTVREAMERDYRTVVLADACADPDAETHAFLLSKIFGRFTTVVDVDALGSLLATPESAR